MFVLTALTEEAECRITLEPFGPTPPAIARSRALAQEGFAGRMAKQPGEIRAEQVSRLHAEIGAYMTLSGTGSAPFDRMDSAPSPSHALEALPTVRAARQTRKWRWKHLKTLIPRSEMVWPNDGGTHKIWC
jgi:hypothetical protein